MFNLHNILTSTNWLIVYVTCDLFVLFYIYCFVLHDIYYLLQQQLLPLWFAWKETAKKQLANDKHFFGVFLDPQINSIKNKMNVYNTVNECIRIEVSSDQQ